jgi:thiosulfate/3-mercaptopyruvate sulfurtransferase
MDGGRIKWDLEKRAITKEKPKFTPSNYVSSERDDSKIRTFRNDVLNFISKKGKLVDVRSPAEFSGEKLHMEGYPQEGALRGGHIPGAKNVPWSLAVNVDGTFKSLAELELIYIKEQGLKKEEEIIAYCRIGERSSHTWFVLKYLMGFENVKNYDGSWTEWGNLVGVPIEK